MEEIYTLNFSKKFRFTDEEFYEFCQDNPELKLERDNKGNIILMALTGGKTGIKNTDIIIDLGSWNRQTKLGKVFDSSTGFKFPDTAVRSPDAAWVSNAQWESLSEKQKEKFPPLCPEFVVELMSNSDNLKEAEKKMKEYIQNGCKLAWLLIPKEQKALIYRKDKKVGEINDFKSKLSGEDILPGFEFDLSVWL